MPIDFACATCGKPYTVRDDLAGRRVRCKDCNAEMRIPGAASAQVGAGPAPSPDPPPIDTSAHPQPSPVQVIVQQVEGKAANGLGVAGVVIGVIAVLICWVPLVNLLVVPLAFIGGILALIGLIVALTNKRSGPGWAVAGMALNGVALGAMFIVNTVVIGAAARAIQETGRAVEKARAEADARRIAAGGRVEAGPIDPPGSMFSPLPPLAPGEEVVLDDRSGSENGVWLVVREEDIPHYVAAQARIDAPIRLPDAFDYRYMLSDSRRIRNIPSFSEARFLGPGAQASSRWCEVQVTSGEANGQRGWVATRFVRRPLDRASR
jgi:hypothetical protein